jgi:broad specificity phosphatase PhoE
MSQTANNDQLCRLYLVRHGETEWNRLNKIQGQLNSPLTPEAVKQTKNLGQELREINFAAAFSSDLGRAVQTAEILALENKITVRTTALLRERYLGILQGTVKDKWSQKLQKMIQNIDNMKRLREIDENTKIESPDKLTSRLIQALREISFAYAGKKVLVVTHSGAMRHLLVRLGYKQTNDIYQIKVENLGYFVLDSDGTDFFINQTHGIYLRN